MLKNVSNPRILEFRVSGLTLTTPAKKVCYKSSLEHINHDQTFNANLCRLQIIQVSSKRC